jgi:hypothetical protein
MLRLKEGVQLLGARPELLIAIIAARDVYAEYGYELYLTSVCDGKHSKGSRHYSGLAVDLRTRNVDEPDRPKIHAVLQRHLGKEFDVVLEPTHLHVEFDPER